eukprot:225067_1
MGSCYGNGTIDEIDETSRFCLTEDNIDIQSVFKIQLSLVGILKHKATTHTEQPETLLTSDTIHHNKAESFIWRPNAQSMAELLVSGFCRDVETKHKLFCNLASVLMDIIVVYTGHCDTWSNEYNRTDVMITNSTVATLLKHSTHTIYGNHVLIYGQNYKWTVKIKATKQSNECILIGLIKNEPQTLKRFELNGYWANNGRKNKGFLFDGSMMMISPPKVGTYYGSVFGKEGDTITLEVDNYTIRFIINDVDHGIAFNWMENWEYRLAVCFVYAGTQIELL